MIKEVSRIAKQLQKVKKTFGLTIMFPMRKNGYTY